MQFIIDHPILFVLAGTIVLAVLGRPHFPHRLRGLARGRQCLRRDLARPHRIALKLLPPERRAGSVAKQ